MKQSIEAFYKIIWKIVYYAYFKIASLLSVYIATLKLCRL